MIKVMHSFKLVLAFALRFIAGFCVSVFLGFLAFFLVSFFFNLLKLYSIGTIISISAFFLVLIGGLFFSWRSARRHLFLKAPQDSREAKSAYLLSISLSIAILLGIVYWAYWQTGRYAHNFAHNEIKIPNRSLEERQKWAEKEFFPTYYPIAVDYIQKSQKIRADVGDNLKIAPAVKGQNEFEWVPGDPGSAYFTLDVQGSKGNGICKISLSKNNGDASHPIGLEHTYWTFNGKEIKLNETIEGIDR